MDASDIPTIEDDGNIVFFPHGLAGTNRLRHMVPEQKHGLLPLNLCLLIWLVACGGTWYAIYELVSLLV